MSTVEATDNHAAWPREATDDQGRDVCMYCDGVIAYRGESPDSPGDDPYWTHEARPAPRVGEMFDGQQIVDVQDEGKGEYTIDLANGAIGYMDTWRNQ